MTQCFYHNFQLKMKEAEGSKIGYMGLKKNLKSIVSVKYLHSTGKSFSEALQHLQNMLCTKIILNIK